jgi:hypothetical protein
MNLTGDLLQDPGPQAFEVAQRSGLRIGDHRVRDALAIFMCVLVWWKFVAGVLKRGRHIGHRRLIEFD